MAASSETTRLIAATLENLRRQPDAATAFCEAAWGTQALALASDRLAVLMDGLATSVVLDLSALPVGSVFKPKNARILLNLLLIAVDSLPGGGTIHLLGDPDDLFLRIEGQNASWPPGMGACLVSEAAARDALAAGSHRLMPLAALLGLEAGIRLSFLLAAGAGGEPPILRMGG